MKLSRSLVTTIFLTILTLTLLWNNIGQQNTTHVSKSIKTATINNPTNWEILLIGLRSNTPDEYDALIELVTLYDGNIIKKIDMGKISAIKIMIPKQTANEFIENAEKHGLVRYVEPNIQLRTNFVPNDPNWTIQWAPQKIQADYAWNSTLGSQQILISVVDTGIEYNHTDLTTNYNSSGYNWVENNTDPYDPPTGMVKGHGTFCAGIIAAEINNSVGIAGLSQSQIMAERVDFYIDECAEAIKHSADQGAKIISCSWGDFFDSNLLHDAIKYAVDKGVLIVAGAGNENTDIPFYPAAYNEVIAVSGTTSSDQKASFSNYGDWIELAAPATNIYSTWTNDSYKYWQGTSFAGPHVVGVAALTWSQFSNFTRDQVRVQLRYTADDLGSNGTDNTFGYGRLNAKKAVETSQPNNDLTILYWDPPQTRIDPNKTSTIRAHIHNFGLNDASNASTQLYANGTLVDEINITSIKSGETYFANFSWTPTQEGNYNLTCSLPALTNETVLVDNVRQIDVLVSQPKTIEVPSDYGTISGAISAANDGDTIMVSSGVYNESITIGKSVSLLGSGCDSTIIQGSGTGSVIVIDAPFVKFSDFTIKNGSTGVSIEKTAQNSTIARNIITNLTGTNYTHGIYITWSYGIHIFENCIHDIYIGLCISAAATFEYCQVIRNNFTSNQYGMLVQGQANRGNLFIYNNFVNNTTPAVAGAHKNSWDSGYPLGGNYWSDYNGTDWYKSEYQNVTGMDGIGDIAYNITGSSGKCKDNYPLMHPWTRPRNWDFEWRGWDVYTCWSWNASSGWRDRRGDVDWDGDVDIFDVVNVQSIYGKNVGDPGWDSYYDLNGDGTGSIFDIVLVTSEYGTQSTSHSGVHSWYSNGSSGSSFVMWQQLDCVDSLRNHTIQFSFYFYPVNSSQNATAKVYYTTATGGQWINGTETNGPASQWNLVSVNATIPEDVLTIQLWIEGQLSFKAYIDKAAITI